MRRSPQYIKWTWGLYCFAFWIYSFTPLWCQAPTPAVDLKELDQRLQELFDESGAPGMIGAIAYGDSVVWQQAIGVTNPSTGTPVDAHTLFKVGALSKVVTALAVLRLVEAGELRLGDRLADHLPDYPLTNPWEETHPLRIEHLLGHTAGFEEIPLDAFPTGPEVLSATSVVESIAPWLEVRWPPGTRIVYSNAGTALAALVVENITGQAFEEYVRQEVFRPLGMTSATYSAQNAKVVREAGLSVQQATLPSAPAGMMANVEDLSRLLRLFTLDGGIGGRRFLSTATMDALEGPAASVGVERGIAVGPGLGLFRYEDGGYLFQGHAGGVTGTYTWLEYLPEMGRGYFVSLLDSDAEAVDAFREEIRAYLTQDSPPRQPVPSVTLPDNHLEGLAGEYREVGGNRHLLEHLYSLFPSPVTFEDGRLQWGLTALRPVGDSLFLEEGASLPSMVFFRAPGGDLLLQSSRATYRREPAWQLWGRFMLLLPSTLVVLLALGLYPLRWLYGWYRGGRGLWHDEWMPLLAALLLGLAVPLLAGGVLPPGCLHQFGACLVFGWAWLLAVALAALAVGYSALRRLWRQRRALQLIDLFALLLSASVLVIWSYLLLNESIRLIP